MKSLLVSILVLATSAAFAGHGVEREVLERAAAGVTDVCKSVPTIVPEDLYLLWSERVEIDQGQYNTTYAFSVNNTDWTVKVVKADISNPAIDPYEVKPICSNDE